MTDTFFQQFNGSGIWYVIHILALNAKDNKSKRTFIRTINTLADNFGCNKCKIHMKKFIENNNLNNYWNINLPYPNIGFFKWTWELHNNINNNIGKPVMELEDAFQLYTTGICKNCDDKKFVNNFLVPVEEPYINFKSR